MSSRQIRVLWTTFLVVFLTFCDVSYAVEERSGWSVVTERSSPAMDLPIPGNRTTHEAVISSTNSPNVTGEIKKVCRGTNSGLGHIDDQYERYQIYKTLYTNCTHVDGNLEIVFLGNQSLDLDFLQNIREITGYVLIVANYIDYIPLTSLRIIRGRTLFEFDNDYYSLYVALNYDPQTPNVGLKELRFTSLHEILAGKVLFFDNLVLCYHDTINWEDILSGEGAKPVFRNTSNSHQPKCNSCHESCKNHCWGSSPDFCQELTRVSCSPQCDGHCFGPLPSQCCHPECAGGCTGPSTSQCWSCKHFDNGGVCENICPQEEIYSPQDYKLIPNPNVKYAYGSLCVDKCPGHLIVDKGACVQDCGAGKTAGKDGKCHECEGPCPKTCVIKLEDSDFIHSNNIGNYTGCTIIQGSIKILDPTFNGDPYVGALEMRPHQLSVLESVQEVTEFVQIQAYHPQFRDLSFLKNLKIIHGRKLDRSRASLQIFKTSLESLNLNSLTEIRNGHIYIANNSRLCYAGSVKWEKIRAKVDQKTIVEYNRNATSCAQDNEVCADECTDNGCWGPLDHQCLSCKNFHLDDRCISGCDAEVGIFELIDKDKECQKCHSECMTGCNGPGPDKCDQCRNDKDGPYCVGQCPELKYHDDFNVCQPCHQNCDGGCTGPRNTVGSDGCNSCPLVVFRDVNRRYITECLTQGSSCADGYYKQMITHHDAYPLLVGKEGCMKCHPECATCTGYGVSFCTSCLHYKQGAKCVSQCTSDHFLMPEENECIPCDSRCLSCTGPTASDCVDCKMYKVYADYNKREENPLFNCTEVCPDFAPVKVTDEKTLETVCVAEDAEEIRQRRRLIFITASSAVFVFLVFLLITACLCFKRYKAKKSTRKLANCMNELDEAEPLKPTTAAPDMSQMRIVSEMELKWGNNILGSGAFGTVFKGIWVPPSKPPTPVAIKVLQESSSGQSKEFLDEARIMCSVDHPCCVRILGICLSAQMMLITQLMPLGCLLEYIRQKKDKIGSDLLLRWCIQIAEGMDHLQLRGIVHCDLAARNVLVETRDQVKITDFGLAKMLEYGHNTFQVVGGKMPIKWLAIESITTRVFTHKSDVWSFGVTLWELFTFGKRPYENIPLRDIPIMLEKGERLCQPSICSIDVYMLMIKCWMAEEETRPCFKDLVKELSKMAEDPQRYLHIPYEVGEDDPGKLSDRRSSDLHMEGYIEPLRKGSTSVRYTKQPTIYGRGNGHLPPNGFPDNEAANGKRPKSSRLSDSIKTPFDHEAPQYEIMSPTEAKQFGRLQEETADGPTPRDAPMYINMQDSPQLSGGDRDSDSGCHPNGSHEYVPMTLPETPAVTNPEYFDSLHDDYMENKLRPATARSSKGVMLRSRMDSSGGTESERSSTEGSEHEYYNFYNVPVTGLQL